ncbi:MAG: CDP-alcohol phosphatidyltransferase family protein [Magnetococcales bacterium]|nr:CDP-alcohol phosphatidyltransferase family protein [Magnetococcales bacterium]
MDYFNPKEAIHQKRFANFRDKVLTNVNAFWMRHGITPNHLTVVGIALLVISTVGGRSLGAYGFVAGFMLFFYVVFDGMDGPLARAMGRTHQGGAIVDICADQLGPVLVVAASIHHMGSNGIAATLFGAFYVGFIALVLFTKQNQITIPFGLLRVKYLLYFVYSIGLLFPVDSATPFMFFFSGYYAIYIVRVVRVIYYHYDQLWIEQNQHVEQQ